MLCVFEVLNGQLAVQAINVFFEFLIQSFDFGLKFLELFLGSSNI